MLKQRHVYSYLDHRKPAMTTYMLFPKMISKLLSKLFYFISTNVQKRIDYFGSIRYQLFSFLHTEKKPSQLNHDHLKFFICTQEHPQKYLYSPQEIKVPGSDFYSHHIQSLEYLPVRLVYRYIQKYHEATGDPLELIKRSCLFFGICEVFLPINTT